MVFNTDTGRKNDFTKSERRELERDVYDYARACGLKKKESELQVIMARGYYGGKTCDSDVSTLREEEVDDSALILNSFLKPSVSESLPTPQIGENSNRAGCSGVISATKTDREKALRKAAKKERRLLRRKRPMTQNEADTGIFAAAKEPMTAEICRVVKKYKDDRKRKGSAEPAAGDKKAKKGRKRHKKNGSDEETSKTLSLEACERLESQLEGFRPPMIQSA